MWQKIIKGVNVPPQNVHSVDLQNDRLPDYNIPSRLQRPGCRIYQLPEVLANEVSVLSVCRQHLTRFRCDDISSLPTESTLSTWGSPMDVFSLVFYSLFTTYSDRNITHKNRLLAGSCFGTARLIAFVKRSIKFILNNKQIILVVWGGIDTVQQVRKRVNIRGDKTFFVGLPLYMLGPYAPNQTLNRTRNIYNSTHANNRITEGRKYNKNLTSQLRFCYQFIKAFVLWLS